ncbi:DUF7344 domain-containing protein [Halosimplex halophilum]
MKRGVPFLSTLSRPSCSSASAEYPSCLDEHGSLALADPADEVTCHEKGASLTEVSGEEVLRMYSSLWHAHIPKLAESGVVEYSQDTDTVRLSDDADAVIRVLFHHLPASEETAQDPSPATASARETRDE